MVLVLSLTAFEAAFLCSKQYSLGYTHVAAHPLKHRQGEKIPVKVTHSQSCSLLHWTPCTWVCLAWMRRWRDGSSRKKLQLKSDHSLLRGGKYVWSTFYYLYNTAHRQYGQQRQDIATLSCTLSSKTQTGNLQASSQPCITVRSATNKLFLRHTLTERHHWWSEGIKRMGEGQIWCRLKEQHSSVCLNHFPCHDIKYDC